MKKAKVYLLTEEELERFDHLLTALGQAYWALARQRGIRVPVIDPGGKITPEEEHFYQLHLALNDEMESDTP